MGVGNRLNEAAVVKAELLLARKQKGLQFPVRSEKTGQLPKDRENVASRGLLRGNQAEERSKWN